MDIGKGKISKALRVFDKFFNKSNTYIPAMHENKPDTFEKTTPQSVEPAAVNFPPVIQKPQAVTENVITRETVIAMLESTDIHPELKSRFIEALQTPEQIKLGEKFLSNKDLYQDNEWCSLICSRLAKVNSPQKALLYDKLLSNPNLYGNENMKRELSWYSPFRETTEQIEAQNRFLDEYVSNPTVQGVYSYDIKDDNIGEINSFMERQPSFLKEYAKQNDLLYFVFGD